MSETTEMPQDIPSDLSVMTQFTSNHFLKRLEEKVSGNNARLLLHAAIIDSGISKSADEALDSEQAKTLCLSLIKKGGPAFSVGQSMYRELPQ